MLRLLAGEPNVLLLDEPTNDLDTDTLASLEDLLDTWPGTILIASHDRYFVERVCETVYALYGNGRLTHLPGGIEEYLRAVGSMPHTAEPTRTGTAAAVADSGVSAADARAAKKELARLERQIGKLDQRETQLHEQMPGNATDYEKVTTLDTELRAVQAERERTEAEWLELADRVG